jgi:type I restriction enzyme S subunit
MSVSLGALVAPVKTWSPERDAPDKSFEYIDLSAVDQDKKVIVEAREVPCAEAPSRARQIVAAGDVLVSTVRPNLNGVARVPAEMDGATASTGFCVLRPHPARLDSAYLFHWVRSPHFVAEMVRRATGASYPAVSDRIVLESHLPLPPVPEQRRIAAILDKVDTLRAKRHDTLAQLDTLTQSIFLDRFGDPVVNSRGWPIKKLGKVGTLDRGVSKHRPRNAPELLGGPYPLVQTGEVANCDGYVRSHNSTYSEMGLRQSKMWPAGTLCVTIAANIAKTGILTFDACFPDSVVGFCADEPATIEFVRAWLSFLQKGLEDAAPESAQKNINLAILRDLDVPIPALDLRIGFAHSVAAVEKLKTAHRACLAELDSLFASLQHRVFRGEL